jgi:hypothetical protein
MITRSQAEALLTLAEALEACERLGVTLASDHKGAVIYWGNASVVEPEITAMQLRVIVSRLVPNGC